MSGDHVFPPEWNWQRYEPVMREWMAQRARIDEEQKRGHVAETLEKEMLSENWRCDQDDKGEFPPFEERERYGDKYIKCLDRLYQEAQTDLRSGRLCGGFEHLSRRNVRLTREQQGHFDMSAEEFENARPKDFEQRMKDRIRNKIVDTVEQAEVKMLERRRRRRR